MARAYHQGRYVVKNPEKYEGDVHNVIYRSSYEKVFLIYCDTNPNILKWSSEETVIPYFWEVDGKRHRYFMDFKITIKTPDGSQKTCLIEVKPSSQTKEPKRTKNKREKTFVNEVVTYTKNQAKWNAAREYCKDRGWEFIIITEKELFKSK